MNNIERNMLDNRTWNYLTIGEQIGTCWFENVTYKLFLSK